MTSEVADGAVASWDDDDTPYKMAPFTGRNILIFSDGTGQAGGLRVDEFRSNVYKLYRATRCGPDTTIDPDHQLAFYDPGLGSKLAAENIKISWLRKIYNSLSSATGLGITGNLIDCYAALMQIWRPGDRIFLFGFSRGAYTVRCLAGILGLCGIPKTMRDGSPLQRERSALRSIARNAVKRVYRHGSGAADADKAHVTPRTEELKAQRIALGKQFRTLHMSDDLNGSNAIPHFIGVWDTVAAVGVSSSAAPMIWSIAGVAAIGVAALLAWAISSFTVLGFLITWAALLALLVVGGFLAYFALRLKFATDVPGHPWWRTLHFTSWKMKFFDRQLNPYVRYARHALALDEFRADFDRVPWAIQGQVPNREKEEGAHMKQLWFAGNHSDIGGSYLGIKFKWREGLRKIVPDATLHPSVEARFNEKTVLVYDVERAYRPPLLTDNQTLGSRYEKSTIV